MGQLDQWLGPWPLVFLPMAALVRFLLTLVILTFVSIATDSAQGETPTPPPAQGERNSAEAIDAAVAELKKNQEELAAKKGEIAELDRKIKDLSSKRDTTRAEADIIDHQLALLTSRLKQAQLELQQTQLNLRVVSKEKTATAENISLLQQEVKDKRLRLKVILRLLYAQEELSLVRVFFMEGSLSDFLAAREVYEELQDQHLQLMNDLKVKEEELRKKQTQLEEQQQDLGQLEALLARQRQNLAGQQSEQEQFLRAKRAEQVQYDQRLAEAKQAREEITRDVFTLKNAGITLKLTEAQDMARYAGKLTGVRPALLLGVLKVETNLGSNVGGGTFPDDMHPASREAFVRVTQKLGLNPHTAPISARPRSYQGWGGAMGPGQFMPDTWERIEARVGELMRKAVPNPYELTDAFVATAIFLADRGAASPAGEYEAVNRYLAGPNWQRFTWYGDRVLAVAAEYEKEGL